MDMGERTVATHRSLIATDLESALDDIGEFVGRIRGHIALLESACKSIEKSESSARALIAELELSDEEQAAKLRGVGFTVPDA